MKGLGVTEGVSGLWHYHLSRIGEYLGLCGAKVMNSNLRLSDWKLAKNPAHMPKPATYCAKCDAARAAVEAVLAKAASVPCEDAAQNTAVGARR